MTATTVRDLPDDAEANTRVDLSWIEQLVEAGAGYGDLDLPLPVSEPAAAAREAQ